MTKRLVDIDDAVLEHARDALGTKTLRETVNAALVEATRLARSRALTKEDLMRIGKLLEDLGDAEVMAQAWK